MPMDADKTWQRLNTTQRDALLVLREEDKQTGRDVQSKIGRSEVAVSRALRQLADQGLINREYANDVPGSGKYNSLSADGMKLTTTIFSRFAEAIEP